MADALKSLSSQYLRAGAAALLLVAGQAAGQDGQPPVERAPAALSQGRQPPRNAEAITGRDFADMLVPGAVQIANVDLSCAKMWVWNENAGGGENPVQRLLIQGDVRAEIGAYRFSAAQAVVWVEQLTQGDGERAPIRQVAVYFDRVSDPGAEAGFAQAGDRLLVTGILQGELTIRFDALVRGRPDQPDVQFVREGERRLTNFLREQAGFEVEEREHRAGAGGTRRPGVDRPFEPNSPLAQRAPGAAEETEIEPPTQQPIFGREGVITFAVGTNRHQPEPGTGPDDGEPVRVIAGTDGQDTTMLMSGGVLMQYQQLARNRTLQINAQRAVVFFEPGPLTELLQFDVDKVKGIYLEGDVVATDGTYTLRGPRVYYDVKNNRATMVDAVFSTYDARRGIPIYVRAKEIRQQSANQWETRRARLSTTSFFDPMLQIGTNTVTITQETVPSSRGGGDGGVGDLGLGGGTPGVEASGELTRTRFDAKGVTLQAGGVPFFWYPRFRGELENFPLRDIRLESSSGSGPAVKTAWDLFGVTGTRPWDGVDLNVLADWYFDRGPAVGVDGDWESEDARGRILAYTLPIDFGRDSLASGA